MFLFILIFWISYGILFAHIQKKYPELAIEDKRQTMGFSILFSFFGPIALLVTFFMSGFAEHGLKFR